MVNAVCQSSAGTVAPVESEPWLTETLSELTVSVSPVTPSKEAFWSVPVTASQRRVSVVSVGVSVARLSVPLPMLNPIPPGTPTKPFVSVSDIVVSVPLVIGADAVSAAVCVWSEKATWPERKPKTSISSAPAAPKSCVV